MRKTQKKLRSKRNKRKTIKHMGGNGYDTAPYNSGSETNAYISENEKPHTKRARVAPSYRRFENMNKYESMPKPDVFCSQSIYQDNVSTEEKTIALYIMTHGEVCVKQSRLKPIEIGKEINRLVQVTVGDIGHVNIVYKNTRHHVYDLFRACLNKGNIESKFIDICRKLAEETHFILEKNGSEYSVDVYDSTKGNNDIIDKKYRFNSTREDLNEDICVVYNSVSDSDLEQNKGQFLTLKLPEMINNKKIKKHETRRSINRYNNPLIETPYEITKSQLITYLVSKGYTRIFLYDDSCNPFTYNSNSE
jgi:hypothetical protein